MGVNSATALSREMLASIFKPRPNDSHKGTYGHALIIAGSKGKFGAAVISAKACLRTGPGLVTVSVPKKANAIFHTAVPEAMLCGRDHKKFPETCSGIAIGPGLGTSSKAKKLLLQLLQDFKGPMVLDADALNIIALNPEMLFKLPADIILTPHPKEFDRLFGPSSTTEDREQKAINLSLQFAWTIVLKGHETMITRNADVFRNTTGNPGLAKGGSGDMLTGMIAAFLAQGYNSLDAANFAVFLHGLAADITLRNQSKESMIATDVIYNLGAAFKILSGEVI